MTQEQAEFISVDKVKNVLSLSVFNEIKNYEIFKERKFCQLVPAEIITGKNVDEKVLIQGIIDLVAIKDLYLFQLRLRLIQFIKQHRNQKSLLF